MATQFDTRLVPTQYKGRDFLSLGDYSGNEILELLQLAAELKRMKREGKPHKLLEGKSVAMYFEKPSNRTRVSFEVGIFDLGAHPIMLRKEEINLGVRETIADTARTLARYVDGIMIRTFAQNDVEELAQWSSVPVINGLTDEHHPCQVLADLLTIQEKLGSFKGHKLVYVGDGNNMAHSLMEGCALVGMDVTIACPSGYSPQPKILEAAQGFARQHGSSVSVSEDVLEAVKDASVLYTDVWASMGQEAESEARKEVFKNYQVNEAALKAARPDAFVLHCLPAHRGEEITEEALERFADVIFEQAENRLHAQKAVMAAIV
jgi:ornithine carbamoyltransferase